MDRQRVQLVFIEDGAKAAGKNSPTSTLAPLPDCPVIDWRNRRNKTLNTVNQINETKV